MGAETWNYVNKEGIGGGEETNTIVHWWVAARNGGHETDGQHLVRGVRQGGRISKKPTVNIWLVRRRTRRTREE